MEAKDYRLLAQLFLWALCSAPWIKEYSAFGAVIGGGIAAVLWYGYAWMVRRSKD
jgi:hypothetical protein